jgi:hypothetical protein
MLYSHIGILELREYCDKHPGSGTLHIRNSKSGTYPEKDSTEKGHRKHTGRIFIMIL